MIPIENEKHLDEILKEGKVVVQFGANFCGPCKSVGVLLERMQKENSAAKFVKVDIEEHFSLASNLKISKIPTVILFINGEEKGRIVGAKSSEEYKQFVTNN